MSSSFLNKLISCSLIAAKNSGEIIRNSRISGDLKLVNKASNEGVFDPQTYADRASQYLITTMIKTRFPNVRIIAEEDLENFDVDNDLQKLVDTDENDESALSLPLSSQLVSITEKDVIVWIDPLDSTNDFTKGNVSSVTVLIGIANETTGEPIAGIIHQPFEKCAGKCFNTIWGVGSNVFGFDSSYDVIKENQRIKSSDLDRTIITTASHMTKEVENYVDSLKPTKIIKCGGAAYKILQVIYKNAHAYVYPRNGTKKWDTCAPDAILKIIGGRLTDVFGQPINYKSVHHHDNLSGIIATLHDDHQYYLSKISNELINTLKSE